MRKTFLILLIFLVGSMIGLLNNFFVNFWMDLGWRRPVADWLVHLGYERLAGYWGLVWINLPIWFSALITGLILGVIIAGLNWLRTAAVFAIGFVLTPELIAYAGMPCNLLLVYGFWVSIWMVALGIFWDLIAISLLILGVWIGTRFKRSKTFLISPKQKQ